MPAKEVGIQNKKGCTSITLDQSQLAGPLVLHHNRHTWTSLVPRWALWFLGCLIDPRQCSQAGTPLAEVCLARQTSSAFSRQWFPQLQRQKWKYLQSKQGKHLKDKLALRVKLLTSKAVGIVPRTFPWPLKGSPGPLSFVSTKTYNKSVW